MTNSGKELSFVEPQRLRELVEQGGEVTIVDVRTPEEYRAGHIEGAINIPADRLPEQIREFPQSTTIVTVCNFGGSRSCDAAKELRVLGYENAAPLRGGTEGWIRSNQEPVDDGSASVSGHPSES